MDPSETIIYKLLEQEKLDGESLRRVISQVSAKYNLRGFDSNVKLMETYYRLVDEEEIEPNEALEKALITKKMRSLSGVSVVTVLTKPYPCRGQCLYCPSEKNVPKSYLSNEPAVMRAIINGYDPYRQVVCRLQSLKLQGHPVDKVELIIIGGTFSDLPKKYQEEFIKRCLDGMNGFRANSLDEAKEANESAPSRCVGLTLETRPDCLNKKEINFFKYLGATRVEMGVQSTDDQVLSMNKRGHDNEATKQATRLLKDSGFKVCYHMMPNLYGSNPKKDIKTIKKIFTDPAFRPDYLKIYPCMVTAGTELAKLWREGKYFSYSDDELITVISEIKKAVPYWLRIMRTIRDIPASSIISGSKTSNLRQIILERAEKEGWSCKCIRCREVGAKSQQQITNSQQPKMFLEEYKASGGRESFLSFESEDREKLYSLLRLRLTKNQFITDIKNAGLVRELHTYGQEEKIGQKGTTQHAGYGKRLLKEAEKITLENGYRKIAVISGIGTREYYRKLGYKLTGEYMTKELSSR
mgnify:CR=1 FL=1